MSHEWFFLLDDEGMNALQVADELLSFTQTAIGQQAGTVQLAMLTRELDGFCAAVRTQLALAQQHISHERVNVASSKTA